MKQSDEERTFVIEGKHDLNNVYNLAQMVIDTESYVTSSGKEISTPKIQDAKNIQSMIESATEDKVIFKESEVLCLEGVV